MKIPSKLRDSGAERALLATIIKNGKDALTDAQAIVSSTDFSLPINRSIFLSLEQLAEEPNAILDLESIKLKIKAIGLSDTISTTKDLEYLELLTTSTFDKSNIPVFALQIKKYAVIRDLFNRYSEALNYLENVNGNEPLSEIIQKAENRIIDYINGVEGANSLEQLTENIEEYIEQVLNEEIVDQVGLPTGFTLFDEAIGGGCRRGTVTVKGARPKTGKSFDALNVGINLSTKKIPVLYLDSELTKIIQKNRMMSIISGCPLYLFETRKFKQDPNLVKSVVDTSKEIEQIPFAYQSISGMDHNEALALMRRWLVKDVGFREDGTANDCLIIYDYLKLTSGNGLTHVTPEYILLGLALTAMHNFAVKYDVPILCYVQLNREGIDSNDTNIVASSDRILWLCSSLSIFRNKDENDISLGCGFEHGNKKLIILETRHGSGLENPNDYINLKASLRPGISKEQATGLITEGFLYSQIANRS